MSIVIVSPSRTAAIGPPHERLRRDVPDHQPARRAAEAAVGHQRDRFAEPLTDDRRGDAEHLAHPGSALRPLVADHDDVAVDDLAPVDRVHRIFFAFEHARAALVQHAFVARRP